MKTALKLCSLFWYCIVMVPFAMGQSKPVATTSSLANFKSLLSTINAGFVAPEGFKEVKPPDNDKFLCQYGLKLPDNDLEVWFHVSPVKAEWQRYEKEKAEQSKPSTNPDSLYIKVAEDAAQAMAGAENYYTRSVPSFVLDRYNADEGKAYILNLADRAETNHYQFGLLITLQKNHYGSLVLLCMSNEKGPLFYRNINKLKDCFKFID